MKISEKCLTIIKQFEGCPVNKEGMCIAYKDSVGVWTIGYGTTNADKSITRTTIKEGLTITKETAEQWLKESVEKKYGPNVMKYDSKYHWNQNQYDALVSFAYNIGSIDKLTKNGTRSIKEISEKIPTYDKADGKVLPGLTWRREAEKKLFDTPVNEKSVQQENSASTAKASDTKKNSISYKAKVIARRGLNIRKESDDKSAKLGALAYGTCITVTKEKNGWGKIKTNINNNSVSGWVYLKYIKKI